MARRGFTAPAGPVSPRYYAPSPYGVVRPHHLGVFVTLRVAGWYDFPPGTVACDSTLACLNVRDSNCTCCMYSYAPLPRSFKVFAVVRQSIYCLGIYLRSRFELFAAICEA